MHPDGIVLDESKVVAEYTTVLSHFPFPQAEHQQSLIKKLFGCKVARGDPASGVFMCSSYTSADKWTEDAVRAAEELCMKFPPMSRARI